MKLTDWQLFRDMYARFTDGKGSGMIITICVAIITASAVWTNRQGDYSAPNPPVYEEQPVALQMQQSLQDVVTPTPLPDANPPIWRAPLNHIEVLVPFSDSMPVYFESSGFWAMHTGIDLHGEIGSPVFAMSEGKVLECGQSPLRGTFVHIEHADGYETHYSGLAMLSALQKGDRVRDGQTIGFVGNEIHAESALGSHLHVEVYHHGKSIDPMLILP